MIYVYSHGSEFCIDTFAGDPAIALKNEYKPLTYDQYDKLVEHKAHWVNGEYEEIENNNE